MKLCIDQETTRRLNKFFTAKNEDRCISLTNLKLGSLTLPAHEGCSGGAPTSKEIALIVGGGRVRILTDISNHVEWDIFIIPEPEMIDPLLKKKPDFQPKIRRVTFYTARSLNFCRDRSESMISI